MLQKLPICMFVYLINFKLFREIPVFYVFFNIICGSKLYFVSSFAKLIIPFYNSSLRRCSAALKASSSQAAGVSKSK